MSIPMPKQKAGMVNEIPARAGGDFSFALV